ncbi:alanine:cation symporter family protein [Bacillus thermocopriae]|uniref:Alanine:cation symporter family protein n=1 Tax=Neobacillus thermocopriae TaxID=1215031 RepID=A0A6B3TMK6_9BACI|nr:alanine/glycine:cation symporter family protein [Neobacillus thermocopriae]MED3622855.1 alanine/glycine:cation symporter family protein [Neobacillus thermocopriae]MED3714687.1 alanine/glycine:cation symporter family protein [Neobacillus thermocopriae]NEX77441.1 alanine:cation symporter family protein [Neobacillus thermocopriae]
MFEQLVTSINGVLWSAPLVIFIVAVGVYFSIRTRFLQIRHIKEMVRLVFSGKSSNEGVSSFQALAMSLSGRIGVGNIAGTATGIAFGGPGSVFWMWVITFIGSSAAFVESTLAQIYKEKQDGEYRGGPAFYIEKGLGWKWFGVIFAIATLLAMAVLMPGIQANSIAEGMKNAFGINNSITGLVVILLMGLIIFGGVKRIARVAELVVPFMALGYLLLALTIIAINFERIPEVFGLIFKSAFGAEEMFGGILGSTIMWGVKRGLYANEAGQGTGAHPAAAAEVSHPAKQGLVQSFSIYLDVFLVVTSTALMILFTNSYNTVNEKTGEFLVENLKGVESGPAYTQAAVDTIIPGFGSAFVAIALFFFAFTTIFAYYYIAETNLAYLVKGKNRKPAMFLLKLILLGSVFYGAVKTAELAWAMGDIGLGIMVWLNLIAIVLLFKPANIALKDYEEQLKKGLDPEFNSTKLGIKNADFWANGYQKSEKEENKRVAN